MQHPRAIAIGLILTTFGIYGADLAASITHRAFYDDALQSGNPIPNWQQDLLVMRTLGASDSVDKTQPNIIFFDRAGAKAGSASIWVEGAARVRMHMVAINAQHDILAGGNAIARDGKLIGFLTLTDFKGTPRTLIETNPYAPHQAVFGPDGSIWALVSLIDMDGSKQGEDYKILRHYSTDGKLLAEMLPRSTFSTALPPSVSNPGADGTVLMQSNKDKLGIFFGHSNLWMEIDNTGKVQQWTVPSLPALNANGKPAGKTKFMWEAAFLDSGSVYFHAADAYESGIYKLDKQKLQWTPVAGASGQRPETPVGRLYGKDGNSLVFSNGSMSTFLWAPIE